MIGGIVGGIIFGFFVGWATFWLWPRIQGKVGK